MEWLVIALEENSGRPVIDETGLKERYDWDVEWKAGATHGEIIRAIDESLGLRLKPARRSVEMLVVEKER